MSSQDRCFVFSNADMTIATFLYPQVDRFRSLRLIICSTSLKRATGDDASRQTFSPFGLNIASLLRSKHEVRIILAVVLENPRSATTPSIPFAKSALFKLADIVHGYKGQVMCVKISA